MTDQSEAEPYRRSVEDWGKIAERLQEWGKIHFNYLVDEDGESDRILCLFMATDITDLPDEATDDGFLLATEEGGFQFFYPENVEDYGPSSDWFAHLSDDQLERTCLSQLVKAICERLV